MDETGGRQSTVSGHDSGETQMSTEGESCLKTMKLSGKRTEI